MSKEKSELIESGLTSLASDNLESIKAILNGEHENTFARMGAKSGLSISQLALNQIYIHLNFTDQLLILFDYQDNGFSSEFRAKILELNKESYQIASPALTAGSGQ